MSNKPRATRIKRLSKGKRAHVRRLKQEAHRASTVYQTGNQ